MNYKEEIVQRAKYYRLYWQLYILNIAITCLTGLFLISDYGKDIIFNIVIFLCISQTIALFAFLKFRGAE